MNTVKHDRYGGGIFQNRMRGNRFQGFFKPQDWGKKIAIQLGVCTLILAVLFTLSKLNFHTTKRVMEITKNSISTEFNVVKNYDRTKRVLKSFVAKGEQAWVVMNLERRGQVQYIKPVEGEILIGFGEMVPKSEVQSKGVVFEVEEGAPILAIAEGVVIEVGSNKAIGNYAMIKHKGEMISVYKYIEESSVELNQKVDTGQQIGNASKILQLEMWHQNEAVDPGAFIQLQASKL